MKSVKHEVVFKGMHVHILESPETSGWRVDNHHEGYEIGYINWFADFKSYTYDPLESTVYTPDCLIEIAKFCADENQKRGS
jgi:hypothetical protein